MIVPVLAMLMVPLAPNRDRVAEAVPVAERINDFVAQHWQTNSVKPAVPVADQALLRRLTLDLVGRIPTVNEARAFAEDRSPDRSTRAIRRLMESPEYSLHMGRVFDEIIQGKFAGDAEFLEYLRTSLAAHKPWNQLFREVMLGPWESPQLKAADRFLGKRLNSLDDLTNDTARVFFGVNVSCAKCHDHPLVPDWTQDHYFGMASFLNRTQADGKGRRQGASAPIMEKTTGDVMFVTTKGERRTAKMMFLSSKVVEEPAGGATKTEPGKNASPFSRREQLVKVALDEKAFFSRSIVNRLWAYFMGRGLVHPVDQMHSANPPAIAGLLEYLGDDLAANGYDLDRLIAALVSSRVYQLASTRNTTEEEPGEKLFSLGRLRAMTPQQFAFSMVLASGDGTFDQDATAGNRIKRYRELEGQIAKIISLQLLDARTDRFQSSTLEALFVSNNAEIQKLVAPAGNGVVARLTAMTEPSRIVDTAVWTIFSRPPEAEEQTYLTHWLEQHKQDRAKACSQLVWALMTSAEFRFNH